MTESPPDRRSVAPPAGSTVALTPAPGRRIDAVSTGNKQAPAEREKKAMRAARMTVSDWRGGYRVVDPTNKEVISIPLWHRLTYTSATTTLLQFFNAAAQGVNGNLELAGQLPNGISHLVQSIRIIICADTTERAAAAPANGTILSALQDVASLIHTGAAEFFVGSKSYGRFPLATLPAGGGLYGGIATSGTYTATNHGPLSFAVNGVPDVRNVYSLPIPIVIPPQYNFRLDLTWAAALTLTMGNTQIIAVLDGESMRPRQ
jgi:hypothetical protein